MSYEEAEELVDDLRDEVESEVHRLEVDISDHEERIVDLESELKDLQSIVEDQREDIDALSRSLASVSKPNFRWTSSI